jgi:hypothetical protein
MKPLDAVHVRVEELDPPDRLMFAYVRTLDNEPVYAGEPKRVHEWLIKQGYSWLFGGSNGSIWSKT